MSKTAENFLAQASGRAIGIDGLKGIASALIVWHHLAFYGPMSDVVNPQAPDLMDWLYDYARMAVQVFLVIGGLLAAGSLAPQGVAVFTQPGRVIARRYLRLMSPLLLAIIITVAVSALVRPWLTHSSVPDSPTLLQVLAHVLMLQDLAEEEALSAGVWYVAIDFQLFALSVLVLALSRLASKRWTHVGPTAGVWLAAMLAVASLLVFNRFSDLDSTALYFFGSYGLGMLAWWAMDQTGDSRGGRLFIALCLVLGLALALEFRGRLVVAMGTALVLLWLQSGPWLGRWLESPWLVKLGKASYYIFLIHFSVCLAVNAVVTQYWPASVPANAAGMLAAFGLSIAAGFGFARLFEALARATRWSFRRWVA